MVGVESIKIWMKLKLSTGLDCFEKFHLWSKLTAQTGIDLCARRCRLEEVAEERTEFFLFINLET